MATYINLTDRKSIEKFKQSNATVNSGHVYSIFGKDVGLEGALSTMRLNVRCSGFGEIFRIDVVVELKAFSDTLLEIEWNRFFFSHGPKLKGDINAVLHGYNIQYDCDNLGAQGEYYYVAMKGRRDFEFIIDNFKECTIDCLLSIGEFIESNLPAPPMANKTIRTEIR